MKHTFAVRKQTPSFRMMTLMLAIAPLWLMLAAANTAAQRSNDVSRSTTTTSPAPAPSNWPQFFEDNMQRWNPNETILGVNNVDSLTQKWFVPLSVATGRLSSPVVANGVVYVGSDGTYAMDASTGSTSWRFGAAGSPGSPAVANGVVYIGANQMYALNAITGAQLWSSDIGDSDFVESSPAVANGVVYFGTFYGSVYALNASTGAKLWSYTTGGNSVFSSPAVANGVVYFSTSVDGSSGNVYALNASNGALLWTYPAWTQGFAVANGVVYFGSSDSNVYALNANTGAKLWSYDTGGAVDSSPAVANGVVYIGANQLYALNALTGAKLWSFATTGGVQTSPAVANGVVYSVSDQLYALNASTGAQLWSYTIGGIFNAGTSSPAVANGMLYLHIAGGADPPSTYDSIGAFELGADLYLRVIPSSTTVHQGDLLTYAFPVWNLGPANANQEVLNTQVPTGTTFDYIRISGTPGLGTCTTPPFQEIGPIVCHQNGSMAPNTTWTVRLTVKVTAPAGAVLFENGATRANLLPFDPNMANNTASVRTTVVEPAQSADLFLRVQPSTTTVHQGDLITYAFPVWNLGPNNAVQEVLNTQVPAGTTFDSIRISGTPGLGTCTTPPFQGTGQIVCHENGIMAPNTTWTVRLTVKVTAPSGMVITENGATMADTFDPNMANNTATVSLTVQ